MQKNLDRFDRSCFLREILVDDLRAKNGSQNHKTNRAPGARNASVSTFSQISAVLFSPRHIPQKQWQERSLLGVERVRRAANRSQRLLFLSCTVQYADCQAKASLSFFLVLIHSYKPKFRVLTSTPYLRPYKFYKFVQTSLCGFVAQKDFPHTP